MFINNDNVYHIEPSALKERIERGDEIVLLDVREQFEVDICRLPHIKHIPIGEIVTRIQELNPEDEIVCICHMGQRSYQVAQYLIQEGYAKVSNLSGGMTAYAHHVDPSLAVY